MSQEKVTKLLPLTENELEALRIIVGAITDKKAIAKMDLTNTRLVLWGFILLPALQSIAEKIKN